MEFTELDAKGYRALNADQYQERRSLVLGIAENPGDVSDDVMERVSAEMDIISAEDARRDRLVELRNHKAAQVIAGAGSVKATTGSKVAAESRKAGDDSLGSRTWEAIKERGYTREERWQVPNIAFRASTDNQTVGELDGGTNPNYYDDALTQVDTTIREGYRRELTVWNLFNHERTDKDTVAWYTEGTLEGDAAMTAEAGAFAQVHVNDPERHEASLKKVTALWKQSEEILSDAPRFVDHVNRRADYRLDVVAENQIVSGDGTGNNITGLTNTSGLLTDATHHAFDLAFIESLLDKRTLIRKATPNFNVDTLLLADEDYDTLMKIKNSDGQYLLGGPVGFVYGQGVTIGRNLWNTITMVPTPALTTGTAVLGAFKAGATVYEHVGGRRFDIGHDGTDFSHGLVTFRAWQRFVLAVEYPAAFCKYTIANGG